MTRSKTISSVLASFAFIILAVAIVSALGGVLQITNENIPTSVAQNAESFPITFDLESTSTLNLTLNWSNSRLTTGSGSINVSGLPSSINSGQNLTNLEAVVNFDPSQSGNIGGIIEVDPSGTASTQQLPFSVQIVEPTTPTSFCEDGEMGTNLSIRSIDVDAPGDNEEWSLLDEIIIEVEVENEGDDRLEDVIVEMALFDSSGNNAVRDLEFSNTDEEEIDLGNIREGDEETAEFIFTIPADMDDGFYRLVFKTYPQSDEREICAEEEHTPEVEVIREEDEDKAVVVEDINFPFEATCSETIFGDFTVYNIGEDDYEDQISVNIVSRELDVSEEIVLRGDFDAGDDERVDFSFAIPEDLEDGLYTLNFQTEYEWDEDDETYDLGSDETFTHRINVIGCSAGPTSPNGNILVDATLGSDAVAGESLTVNARITNTGSQDSTFAIGILGFESWASLQSVSERVIELDSGQTKTITITFNVNEGASGAESFTIEARDALSGEIELQQVEVNIEGQGSLFDFDFSGSGLIWVVAIVNIILIILIILVAVRLSRR